MVVNALLVLCYLTQTLPYGFSVIMNRAMSKLIPLVTVYRLPYVTIPVTIPADKRRVLRSQFMCFICCLDSVSLYLVIAIYCHMLSCGTHILAPSDVHVTVSVNSSMPPQDE